MPLGVTTEVALAGDRITINPKGLEEDGKGSPLRMPQSMITSTMPGPSLFEDEQYPPLRCAFSDAEYEARQ